MLCGSTCTSRRDRPQTLWALAGTIWHSLPLDKFSVTEAVQVGWNAVFPRGFLLLPCSMLRCLAFA